MRFLGVGVLNTAADFLVLNALLFVSGPEVKKSWYVVFKIISFLAAVTQSYFLNRRWVFVRERAKEHMPSSGEKKRFLAVSVTGFGINIASSYAVFVILGSAGLFNQRIDANLGALAGSVLTQVSNYIGYKFLVFNTHHGSHLSIGDNTGIQGIKANRENAS
jgi:putative flippase GtrA